MPQEGTGNPSFCCLKEGVLSTSLNQLWDITPHVNLIYVWVTISLHIIFYYLKILIALLFIFEKRNIFLLQ